MSGTGSASQLQVSSGFATDAILTVEGVQAGLFQEGVWGILASDSLNALIHRRARRR